MAAALLRIWAAASLDALPAHFAPDEPLYRELAAALEAGRSDERLQFVSPLYPLLVASLGGAAAISRLQLMLGSLVPALVYLAARRAGASAWAAAFAAGLVLLHAPLLAFDAALLPSSLAITLLAMSLALSPGSDSQNSGSDSRNVGSDSTNANSASRTARTPALTGALAAGTCSALAVLCAPALLPIPILWAALWAWRAPKDSARSALALILPLLLALAASAARNHSLGLGASPFGANAGITFAHGNLSGAQGEFRSLPGSDASKRNQHVHARASAQTATGRTLDWTEVDRYWRNRALAERASAPLDTLFLETRKLLRFAFQPFAGDELGIAALREQWPHLRSLPVPFPLLFVLGVIGIALGSRGAGSLAISGGTLLTCLIFYVSDRYRLPAVVGLALPAGTALARLRQQPSPLQWGGWALILITCVVTLQLAPDELERGRRAARDAEAAEYRGDLPGAIAAYRAMHAERPGLASSRGLGRSLLADERNREALEFLAGARTRHPQDAGLANDHGVALLRHGRLIEARAAFEVAADGQPPALEGIANLGVVLERLGRYEAAVDRYSIYTRTRPEAAAGWLGLARAFRHIPGRTAEARQAARRAGEVANSPAERSQARAIEALLERDAGNQDEWRRLLDQLRQDGESGPAPWMYLAREAEREGRDEEARAFAAAARAARERR